METDVPGCFFPELKTLAQSFSGTSCHSRSYLWPQLMHSATSVCHTRIAATLEIAVTPTAPARGKVGIVERSSCESKRQFFWHGGDYTAMAICAGGGDAADSGRSDSGGRIAGADC